MEDIYFALWLVLSSTLFFLPGWISCLSTGITFHLFPSSSPFFVLWLKNGRETGPWWQPKLPVWKEALLKSPQSSSATCLRKYRFWFYFLLLVRNLNWTVGSRDYHGLTPIKPQSHSPEFPAQSIPPSFNEKRKVTNFTYKGGYWKIPLVCSRSASNSQHFMSVILSERDFSACGSPFMG